jgi:PAS domain S-box-containing protein
VRTLRATGTNRPIRDGLTVAIGHLVAALAGIGWIWWATAAHSAHDPRGARAWALLGLALAATLSLLTGLVTYLLRARARNDAALRLQQEQALRENEGRLRTILDGMQAGVVLVDRDTHVIADVNRAALATFGVPREAVVGATCHEFICPAECGRCPVTDLGQSINSSEREVLAAGGRRIPVVKTVVLLTLRGREYLLESFIDVADRKRAEQELAEHRARLEELVRERTLRLVEAERQVLQAEKLASVGRLAAGVAHEINTPIQYVGDNLRALADFQEDLGEVVRRYRELVELVAAAQVEPDAVAAVRAAEEQHDLEFILEDAPKAVRQGLDGVERVANIVRAMKDFSHIKGGEASAVDLNHCLRSTLTVARNEYKYVADVETRLGELPPVEC